MQTHIPKKNKMQQLEEAVDEIVHAPIIEKVKRPRKPRKKKDSEIK